MIIDFFTPGKSTRLPITYPLLQDVGTLNLVIWTSIICIDLWHRNSSVLFDPLERRNLDMPQTEMSLGMICI